MNKITVALLTGLFFSMLLMPFAFAEKENAVPTQPDDEIDLPINIPKGDNFQETNTANGIDDDNDGIIDESANLGTCMIIIYNNNDHNDDEWELIVDNKSEGFYRQGKARFWDLMLDKGMHDVFVKAIFDNDNDRNYSIWFESCNAVKGPMQDGFNNSEKELYEWKVEVK